ncbi:glutathione S-transferase family protein [Polaromonas sp.]|uniref:glutathione S-transferase family protein n=1 Tax=Polaromonas sp. TaxID=1869339 RepID=UPI0037511799
MLTLCGSPISNYYNKVKLALLEKGLPFSEEFAATHSSDEAVLSASPLGKIPFVRTAQGGLCESQAILDYIEATKPQPALLPADPFEAAKVRELTTFIDWHLEIVARQLYASTFFGAAPLSEGNLARTRQQLETNIAAFKKLAKFAPYVAGETFSQADCAAFSNLPLIGMASKAAFGEDLLIAGGVDYKPYVKFIGERPSAQKVVADRKAAQTKV